MLRRTLASFVFGAVVGAVGVGSYTYNNEFSYIHAYMYGRSVESIPLELRGTVQPREERWTGIYAGERYFLTISPQQSRMVLEKASEGTLELYASGTVRELQRLPSPDELADK